MAAKNRFNPIDCLGAALPDEEYFVLLARDPAMPAMLGIWASLRVGNLQAATDNFMLLMEPGLVQHYMEHPDIAKSEEAIETANRAAEWRAENVGGPNAVPTWKKSLVRPQMMTVEAVNRECDADEAVARLDKAFGFGVGAAHDHIREDTFASAIYQCALAAMRELIDELREAKQGTDNAR